LSPRGGMHRWTGVAEFQKKMYGRTTIGGGECLGRGTLAKSGKGSPKQALSKAAGFSILSKEKRPGSKLNVPRGGV